MAKKDYFEEYFAPDQGTAKISNDTIGTNNQRPREARRIWKTLNSVEGWVKYRNDGYATDAMAGLLVTVIGDGDNNGVYMITYADPVNAFYQSEADANGIIRANAAYNTTLGLVKVADARNINGLVGIQIVADSLNLDDNPSIDPGHYVISTEERKLVDANSVVGTPTATYTIAPGDAPAMASDVKAYVDATSVLQESITVMGDGAGNMTNGDTFEAGITLAEALRQIFVQEIMTTPVHPQITFTAKNGNKSYISYTHEVGTQIPELTLSTVISTDGYYESANKNYYTNEAFDKNNGTYATTGQLFAECEFDIDNPTYSANGAQCSGNTVSSFYITEGNGVAVLNTSAIIKANPSKMPKTSLNRDDEVAYNNLQSVTKTANITLNGRYKYFYGYCNKRGDGEYSQLYTTKAQIDAAVTSQDLIAGYCEIITIKNPNGETSVAGNGIMKCPSDKNCFVLILPSTHNTILSTNNGMFDIEGEDLINAWGGTYGYNSISYTNGNATTTYYVHVLEADYNLQYEKIKFN